MMQDSVFIGPQGFGLNRVSGLGARMTEVYLRCVTRAPCQSPYGDPPETLNPRTEKS